jgi:hypothetical protein
MKSIIYTIVAIFYMVLAILCLVNILKPDLEIISAFCFLSLALYYGHRTFLDKHTSDEIEKTNKPEE